MYQDLRIVPRTATPATARMAVELAHLLGFESVAMTFPILARTVDDRALYFVLEERPGPHTITRQGSAVTIGFDGEGDLSEVWHDTAIKLPSLTGREAAHPAEAPEGYLASTAEARAEAPFDGRARKGLESLFDKDYILLDQDHDMLPDRVDAHIELPDDPSHHQLSAACALAARLGMETTCARFPITAPAGAGGHGFVFRPGPHCGLSLMEASGRRTFLLAGDGPELEAFTAALCQGFPLQKHGRRWVDLLLEMAAALAMETLDGQLAWLERHRGQLTDAAVAYCSPKVAALSDAVRGRYAPARLVGYKDLRQVHTKTYDIQWEVDTLKALLDTQLWPQVKAGDRVRIHARVSEDKAVRSRLTDALEARLADCGAQSDGVQVLCAYKQGFSWLEEVVMPRLAEAGADRLEIAFRPFLPPGVTQWQDEDGATPSYTNVDTSDPDRWYDLPIRALQELYPIDDILARGLGISRDSIDFTVYRGSEALSYQVRAYRGDKPVLREDFTAYYSQRPYLDAFPGMGKVHPNTGHVTAWINGQPVLDQRIETDIERVWDIYQSDILPYARAFAQGKTADSPTVEAQPFFAQLRLDIGLSEPNERLGLREDMISSLNALHEDIYFVGTDFFKTYGATTTGQLLDAPGLILPVITKRPGKPSLTFTLYDQQQTGPCIDLGGRCVRPDFGIDQLSVTMEALGWEQGKLVPVIRLEGPEEALRVAGHYIDLLEAGVLRLSGHMEGMAALCFRLGGDRRRITLRQEPEPPKDLDIRDMDLLEGQLIGPEDFEPIAAQLRRVPGLAVYPVAESYQGRDIYAIELLPSWPGYVSATKRISRGPSLFINARHHANEVSATNAGLQLIRQLLTDARYAGLADRMSLVMVPMENPDGAAIHHRLQQDNPNWKLHIARYSAIGKEFYHEYFNDRTIHTEALAYTRLWRRWLPDVIVDNHGVPSHEWDQPLSGYTSPSFKGFWLPRSLLYGYFWTASDQAYAGNLVAAKAVEAAIARTIGGDSEIEGWNRDWQNRFEKYAHAWMPRLFPADYYENMINYWIPNPYAPGHRYASVRYPWITTIAYTSEVADETAQGDYLALCARAHTLHDTAMIDLLARCICPMEARADHQPGAVRVIRRRLRPVMPGGGGPSRGEG